MQRCLYRLRHEWHEGVPCLNSYDQFDAFCHSCLSSQSKLPKDQAINRSGLVPGLTHYSPGSNEPGRAAKCLVSNQGTSCEFCLTICLGNATQTNLRRSGCGCSVLESRELRFSGIVFPQHELVFAWTQGCTLQIVLNLGQHFAGWPISKTFALCNFCNFFGPVCFDPRYSKKNKLGSVGLRFPGWDSSHTVDGERFQYSSLAWLQLTFWFEQFCFRTWWRQHQIWGFQKAIVNKSSTFGTGAFAVAGHTLAKNKTPGNLYLSIYRI